jgi:penicillin-binding protein-related factor A (putative recombinase)
MVKNTGIPSEKIFDDYWASFGRRAALVKFEDAAALYGKNKRPVANAAKPSDRLVTFEGETFYAEVKSTIDPRRFGFNKIRKTQRGYAKQITAAGGRYDFYIHSLHLDQWFRVPAQVILTTEAKSLSWEELKPYETSLCVT